MTILDKKIDYFILVVEKGSFSAAGRERLLSQAAISQQISLLEQELSCTLFDRSGYKPTLTEEGKIFYKGCKFIQEQGFHLEKEIHDGNNHNLCIGFTGAYENRELLGAINQYKEQNPLRKVTFVKNDFRGCVKDLLEGKTDLSFGLSCEFINQEEINYLTLFHYELCVICAPSHRFAKRTNVKGKELQGETLVMLSEKYGEGYHREFMKSLSLDGVRPRNIQEADTMDEMIFYISTGAGVGITARNVVKESNIHLATLTNSHHKSEAALAYRKNPKNPAVLEFVNICQEFFKQYK